MNYKQTKERYTVVKHMKRRSISDVIRKVETINETVSITQLPEHNTKQKKNIKCCQGHETNFHCKQEYNIATLGIVGSHLEN